MSSIIVMLVVNVVIPGPPTPETLPKAPIPERENQQIEGDD